jgi:hypothetical protein
VRRVRRNRCVEPQRNGSPKLLSGHWERESGWEGGACSSLQPCAQSVARESERTTRLVGRCVSCVLSERWQVSVCEEMMRLRGGWRLFCGCIRVHLVIVCVCVSLCMSRPIGEEVAVWYVLSSGIYCSYHRGEERCRTCDYHVSRRRGDLHIDDGYA